MNSQANFTTSEKLLNRLRQYILHVLPNEILIVTPRRAYCSNWDKEMVADGAIGTHLLNILLMHPLLRLFGHPLQFTDPMFWLLFSIPITATALLLMTGRKLYEMRHGEIWWRHHMEGDPCGDE